MVDGNQRTEPSPIKQLTPPGWNENGSSLGPQLLLDHRQDGGPPGGVAFWLMAMTREAGAMALLGPEKPLVPESGSAHVYMRRPFVEPPLHCTPSFTGEGRDDRLPQFPALG